MKKRIFAIVMILVFSLTTLTACSNTTDMIDQITTEFNTLVADAATLSQLLISAVAAGLDVSAFTGGLMEIMTYISNFAITSLGDLTSNGLELVMNELADMSAALAELLTGLQAVTGGLTDAVDSATTAALDAITAQLDLLTSAVTDLTGMVQSLLDLDLGSLIPDIGL
jgi:uncharacterized membrane protein YciS (DUF1049 family)